MKFFFRTLCASFVMLGVIGCGNGKKTVQSAPASFESAYYSIESSSSANEGNTVRLHIPVNSSVKNVPALDSAYFRGRVAPLVKETEKPLVFVATYEALPASGTSEDRVMHADPRKEFGNKPSVVLSKIPFDLAPDEAMLSYRENREIRYYKLSEIREKGSLDKLIPRPGDLRHEEQD